MLPTPIRTSVLLSWLSNYPNHVDAVILGNGFTNGFLLGHEGRRVCRDSGCLASAAKLPNAVKEELAKEKELGRIAGPFVNRSFAALQCSPIGLVPKQIPNSYRLIQHLSFPQGSSINDHIGKGKCKVHFASFDKAFHMIMGLGRGAWLAKSDIKSVFLLLPVSPLDYELLGFTFEDNTILTNVYLWAVLCLVHCLRSLAHS